MTSEISLTEAQLNKRWVFSVPGLCVVVVVTEEVQRFEQNWHVAVSSLVRKMEADMPVQFFVRNIHLHEESRVKNLICKAI